MLPSFGAATKEVARLTAKLEDLIPKIPVVRKPKATFLVTWEGYCQLLAK